MRYLAGILLFLLLSLPVYASTPVEQMLRGPVQAIAWVEGESLYVAVANDSIHARTYTIEAESHSYSFRPLFDQRSVNVASRTVSVQSFYVPSASVDFSSHRVRVTEQRSHVVLPIQNTGVFQGNSYVVQEGGVVQFAVDIQGITQEGMEGRVVIDDSYQVIGTTRRGQINISSFEGGYTLVRNTIQYKKPSLEVGMRAPGLYGVNYITFSVSHFVTLYPWGERRETIGGPIVMVVGPELRLVDGRPLETTGTRGSR